MYDLVVAGAGLTAATLASCLKHRLKILVLDVRPHLGGNCYDYSDRGTMVHLYGPHIFHSSSDRVVSHLNRFTQWRQVRYAVSAEVEVEGRELSLPFPYSAETERKLGRPMDDGEIVDTFYRGYSEKMWGMGWEGIPNSVKVRVPKRNRESAYFPGEFSAVPALGYARMIENMFDGVEVVLGADRGDWLRAPARHRVFCGRPDLLLDGHRLEYRSLDIRFDRGDWSAQSVAKNFCRKEVPQTRQVRYSLLTGGESDLIGMETPRRGGDDELNPYYPVPTRGNLDAYRVLKERLLSRFDNLSLLGRAGSYRYMDMDVAVAAAMTWAEKFG